MKAYSFFLILFCMIGFFFFSACEKTALQTTSNELITPRTFDCADCPIDDCCCAIELLNTIGTYTFNFCNTTNGIGLCTGGSSGGCSVSNNGGQHFTLDQTHFKHGFCVDPDASFWIYNNAQSSATVRLTCEYDEINPQSIQITIPALTRYYFDTDNDCQVSSCQ